ncbi:MAG: MarR family winged helix-turn-helix transcriptional regulator [Acidimicrobiales bacterium]
MSTTDAAELVRAEQDVQAKLGDLKIDFDALAAVSNIFRAASAARTHLERTVLSDLDLSFTAFTVLWVLWVWGEQESRVVAVEAGITKGTLTGVVNTLERRGLVRRRPHDDDRRLVLIAPTDAGEHTMNELFPRFNREEARIASGLGLDAQRDLAGHLRQIQRTLEALSEQ